MKTYTDAVVVRNQLIGPDIYDMTLDVPGLFADGRMPVAGQFVGLYTGLGEMLLPRPISICEAEPPYLRLVYQAVGQGTRYFAALPTGMAVKLIGPLGNGFSVAKTGVHWLVGGGIGAPPLLWLAKSLRERQSKGGLPEGAPPEKIVAFLGFHSAPILVADFHRYCDAVWVATDDGSCGFHGHVLQCITANTPVPADWPDAAYACGPSVMLGALAAWAADKCDLQVSLEARMACGLGACVGCAVRVPDGDRFGYKKVCKDGPVFDSRAVDWTVPDGERGRT